MRVLWLGDAGAHTGFATVTHNIGERLVRDYGHDIHVLAINHRGDYWPTNLKLYMPTLMVGKDIYGFSRVIELMAEVMPQVVVIVNDPAVVLKFLFDNKYDEERVLLQVAPLLMYMPIDGIEQPAGWKDLTKLGKVVMMTEFGREVFAPDSPVVPHGVNTTTYRPVSDGSMTMSDGRVVKSKKDCKRVFGFDEDGFLVLRVDRNSYRKNYPDTVRALWPLLHKYNDIEVHFHCIANDPAGFNLGAVLSRDLETKDRFIFPGNLTTFKGWPESDLAVLYNAADVFVSTAWGEGFGLTLAEAAACGLPIVASNFSSIPEVVGPGGILIEPVRPITVPAGQDQMLPDVEKFRGAIEKLYMSKGLRRDLGAAAREHVVGALSWDNAAKMFDQFMRELTGEAADAVRSE